MDGDTLFPEDIEDLEEDIEEDDIEENIGYKIAPYFDSKLGDFLTNGNGQLIDADGVEAWKQWCDNIMSTTRYAHDAYTDDIGIDYEEIFKAESHEEIELLLETEITEALMCDPYGRTQYVQNVEFEWINVNELNVRVEVVGMDSEIILLEKELLRAA